MLNLPQVTLIGVDCVDIERLILACNISTKNINFGSVKLLTSLESNDPRIITIDPITSTESYSEFMIKDLHKHVETPFVIIFQYDGFILNSEAWDNNFLDCDYIGAPWYHLGSLHVGNGGFSLRSKRLIDWLAKNYNSVAVRIHPEDVFISRFVRPLVEAEGMKFATEEIASKFSKEGNEHSVMWNGEFGFHGITYTDLSYWKEANPGYDKRLDYPLDDYCTLMKKHPIYDGTVHTLRFGKYNLTNYERLSQNQKDYEIRLTRGKHEDLSTVKEGHTIVFKRSDVKFKDFPISAFEKKVTKIEAFLTKGELREKYPDLFICPPFIHKFPLWKRVCAKFFPDYFCDDTSYTILWF